MKNRIISVCLILVFSLFLFSCNKSKKKNVEASSNEVSSLIEQSEGEKHLIKKPSIKNLEIKKVKAKKDNLRRSPLISSKSSSLSQKKLVKDIDSSLYFMEAIATEGGSARFIDGAKKYNTEYLVQAVVDKGWVFDRWEVLLGDEKTSLLDEIIAIDSEEKGVLLKACFIKSVENIYVNKFSAVSNGKRDGTRKAPFQSINNAIRLATKNLQNAEARNVKIRISSGNYYLGNRESLILVEGIELEGGYDRESWLPTQEKSRIFSNSGYQLDSLIEVQPLLGNQFGWQREKVTLLSLQIDTNALNTALLSSAGVPFRLQDCRFSGFGEVLVDGDDCGVEIRNCQFLTGGKKSTAIRISRKAGQEVTIENCEIMVGALFPGMEEGIGIEVSSFNESRRNRIKIVQNHIVSSIGKNFTGLKIKNGLIICERNRIESRRSATGVGFGMSLKGEAVVNQNSITLDSEEGYGLSLLGNSYPGRILNNTIVTRSISSDGQMTACGEIEGNDLLISHNVFVNPENENAAALGINLDTSSNRIFNNRVISNNSKEKQRLIGLNGNTDDLPDDLKYPTIFQNGAEVRPD